MRSFEWIETEQSTNQSTGIVGTAVKVKLTGEMNLFWTRLDLASRGIVTTPETQWIDEDNHTFFWDNRKK